MTEQEERNARIKNLINEHGKLIAEKVRAIDPGLIIELKMTPEIRGAGMTTQF